MSEEELNDDINIEDDGENTAKKISKSNKDLLESPFEDIKEPEYILTGNTGVDLALSDGKGLPVGCSVLLWAEPGCGKTTLVADLAVRLINIHKANNIPFKVLYLAVEGSRQLMYSLGLREYMLSKDFIYVEKPLCWRQVETFYNAILNKAPQYKDVKMIVIDSVQNVLSDANKDKSVADGDFGTRPKERGNFYSKYLPLCKEKGITNFLISQVRVKQGTVPGQDSRRVAASYGDKHNVDVILKCGKSTSRNETKKEVIKTVFGSKEETKRFVMTMTSNAADCKNRYVDGTAAEVLIEKGVGVLNWYAIYKILEANKFIKQTGGWYSFNKHLCEAFGLPEKKMHKEEIGEIIKSKEPELIEFLRGVNCYAIQPNDEVIDSIES